jgi:hypothetical protein
MKAAQSIALGREPTARLAAMLLQGDDKACD